MASFSPAEDAPDKPIYFVEVQFQPKEDFYARFFGESFLYLYRKPSARDWRAVAIFARRGIDPGVPVQYQELFARRRVRRVCLDELGETADRSVGAGMIQLIVESSETAGERARGLIQQAQQTLTEEALSAESSGID
nr:DUF2887 domain-containing protein [Oscillatoria sp. PCC 10802]